MNLLNKQTYRNMGTGDPWAGQERLMESPLLASTADNFVPEILGIADPTGSEQFQEWNIIILFVAWVHLEQNMPAVCELRYKKGIQ